jgi:hypothetical protein
MQLRKLSVTYKIFLLCVNNESSNKLNVLQKRRKLHFRIFFLSNCFHLSETLLNNSRDSFGSIQSCFSYFPRFPRRIKISAVHYISFLHPHIIEQLMLLSDKFLIIYTSPFNSQCQYYQFILQM